MKYVQCCVAALLLNLITVQAVFAGSLGDRFRNWLLGSEAQAATLTDTWPELDKIAQGCVQCHDGARATHITIKDAETPPQLAISGAQVNHPVGMYYDDYATAMTGRYTPRFSLDPNIVLVNGKVTCISCHRLKETATSDSVAELRWDEVQPVPIDAEYCSASEQLTVGPRETDLCLACHSM